MEKRKQLIFDECDSYVFVEDSKAVIPQWPVQDEGGRWHAEAFPGQRVLYGRRAVNFGFLADEIPVPGDDESLDGIYLVQDVHRPFAWRAFVLAAEVRP